MPPVLCTAVPVSVSAPAYDPRVQSAAGLRVCCRPLLSARLHLPAGLRACHISLRSPVQVRRPATCHASSQKPCWLPACHGSRPTSEHIQAELPPVPEEKSGITHPGAVPSRVMLVPPRVRPFYCQSIGTANGAPPLRDHAHARYRILIPSRFALLACDRVFLTMSFFNPRREKGKNLCFCANSSTERKYRQFGSKFGPREEACASRQPSWQDASCDRLLCAPGWSGCLCAARDGSCTQAPRRAGRVHDLESFQP